MNNEEQPKIMSVNSLIALCYILDDYKKLDNSLKNSLTNKNYIKVCNDLNDMSQNPRKLGGKTAREIYKENKNTINTIAKYTNVNYFLNHNDAWYKNAYSKRDTSYDLDYFYKYIMNNKTKLIQIKSVLTKIKKIGIRNLELDENIDFTKNTYQINKNFNKNYGLYYLDNITVIPNYDDDKVKFKTISSPYEISTKPDLFPCVDMKEDISKYDLNIKLNNLTFDINRLPNKIDKNIVFNNLLYLKRRVNETCNNIKGYVDLNSDIEQLREQYDQVVKDLINIDDLDNKQYTHQILMNLNEKIALLEAICDNYKDKLIDKNENISKNDLEEELINQKLLKKSGYCLYDV